MMLAKLSKVSQMIKCKAGDDPMRIQRLRVESPGHFRFQNGKSIRLDESDIGRVMILETNIKNPLEQNLLN